MGITASHRARVRCEDAVYSNATVPSTAEDAPAIREGTPPAYPTGNELHFAANPGAGTLFTFDHINREITAFWLGETDGWVHVASDARLAFDGWVPRAEVTKTARDFDSEHGSVLDDYDRCPNGPRTIRIAPVWSGRAPAGAPALYAEEDALIDVEATRGEYFEFRWRARDLEPPPGEHFFVRRSDVDLRPNAPAACDE